jgi:hypothetical protein
MNSKIKQGRRWALIALLGLWVFAPLGSAHEGAEVSAYPATVAPGETLFVEGADINPNGPIALFLEGVKGKFRLGQVQGNADGGFKTSVAVPPDLPPGAYLLTAIGANGVRATFTVTVAAAASPVTQEPREPTDALMALDRTKSSGDWTVIGLLLGLSLLLGAWLIRPERRDRPREGT